MESATAWMLGPEQSGDSGREVDLGNWPGTAF